MKVEGCSVPPLRGVLRRGGCDLLVHVPRPDRDDRPRYRRRPRLPDRLLRAVHRPPAAAQRPEDNPDADISEGTGEIGFFSPHSWWPLFTGLAAALASFGLAVGWWLFLIGMLCVLLSAIGFVFEYYRGHYAH